MKKRSIGHNAATSRLSGVSTAADVKVFRSANTALTEKVTSSKNAARTYVRALEKSAGIASSKKK